MKQRRSFEVVKNRHKNLFSLSKDLKITIAQQNLKSLLVLLHLLFIFAISNFLVVCLRGNTENREFLLSFFGFFIVLSIVDIILLFCIKHFVSNEHYFIKNIPFYIAFFSVLGAIIWRSVLIGSSLSAVLLIACVSLIVLIFCNIDPMIFSSVMLLAFLILGHFLLMKENFEVIGQYFLFYLVLGILAHYKRAYTKESLTATAELEAKKKTLEREYTNQAFEIEEQAIELLHNNRKLLKIQNETIISLSNLVENRDSDTGAHVKRTSEYVNILVRGCLNRKLFTDVIDYDYVDLVTKSAPLHDIGKIVVPDAILKKPGKLTENEFNEIKRHTTEGGKIVRDVLGVGEEENYIQMASDIAMYHHEKWDGTGYPEQRKENEIPLSARLMAIADVFDALVSKRCYKASMSFEDAFTLIKESAGSHFDPQLVGVFMDSREDVLKVAENYKDEF